MLINELSTKTIPAWRRAPATVSPPAGIEDFKSRSNEYFTECAETDTRPTLTGYALAVGLPGPTSLIRLGQRIPELRYTISRCITAVAAGYEDMVGFGNAAGPLFMLKNIPDFDPDEMVGSPPVQFFNDKKEITLHASVTGAARSDSEYDNEDPLDTYIRLIQRRDVIHEKPIKSEDKGIQSRRKILTIISEGWDDE